jgi:hypothetical protein
MQAFGRFDEILYLVEKPPALTRTDFFRYHVPVANPAAAWPVS